MNSRLNTRASAERTDVVVTTLETARKVNNVAFAFKHVQQKA